MTLKPIVKHMMLVFIIILAGCAQYETAVEKLEWLEPDTFTCDVVQVKSGDRFLCQFPDLQIETIDLAGITIPQDMTAKAKKFSESVLTRGTLINIEPDKEIQSDDGAMHAYVWVPGGKMLNTVLIERGYAKVQRDEVSERYEAVFIRTEDQNKGEETEVEVIEEVETEKKPWVK